jgi:hypothetical protein
MMHTTAVDISKIKTYMRNELRNNPSPYTYDDGDINATALAEVSCIALNGVMVDDIMETYYWAAFDVASE